MKKRKICVVTGTRAEYGLLYWLMKEIQQDPDLELQIIATGMHLSPEFGLTYRQIEEDGFMIDEKVEMLLSADTASSIGKSIGLGTIGFSDSIPSLNPDLIIILGDRFEALAAAQSALISNVPIAHIHGGEITYGAYDDAIRHAITKMSYLHFVSTEAYLNRVVQLGEAPDRVFNVGALGVENIKKLRLLSKNELEKSLHVSLNKLTFLITYHPTTLSENPLRGTVELLDALKGFKDITIVFTKANADNQGRKINQMINDFVNLQPANRKIYDSLGTLRYLSLLKYSNVVIGNSSSGILEAPYVDTPTVNIGDRQKGRVRSNSVFDCSTDIESIVNAINKALNFEFIEGKEYKLYGDGNSSVRIMQVLKNSVIKSTMKEFYDGEVT
ncbi:UDP-N-acetylglucosamine 2-epimerase [Virgibacillus byunsanensis]|uniref:UDP-N-acetylglucosamine 2-epimerase n=1 Tax=Virgibacillus byunsanensis TaxID=570945 RepID=A0ABW3LF99_9BACI